MSTGIPIVKDFYLAYLLLGKSMEGKQKLAGSLLSALLIWFTALLVTAGALAWLLLRNIESPDPNRNWKTTNLLEEAALGLEAFRVLHGTYPAGEQWIVIVDELKAFKTVSELDAWGRELVYSSDGSEYVLASCGADGACDSFAPRAWPSGNYDQDIVIKNGRWLQVRSRETHVDVSVAMSEAQANDPALANITVELIRNPVTSGNVGLEILTTVAGNSGYRNGRWTLPELGPRGALKFQLELPLRESQCVVAVAHDSTRKDEDYRDNVATLCPTGLSPP